ncbi:hypothetical protein ABTK11_21440, partial [Acinetobacter baumannii]
SSLLLTARETLDIGANASLKASTNTTAAATTWTLSGDGAAVLLSARSDSQLLRQGAALATGNLVLRDSAALQATGGRVQLDAT